MTLIVAEIGINHNGSVDLAKQLIDLAAECDCDAVKFQKRDVDTVYSEADQAMVRASPWGVTNGDQKRGLEFGWAEYEEIDRYCKHRSIPWFASAWDLPSLDFLDHFDLPYNKIASALITHDAFVDAVIQRRKPTFVSTGMTTWERIEDVAERFRRGDCPFTLMHCVSTYPTPPDDINLAMIPKLKEIHSAVGYSGHEADPWPSIGAVWMGAEVVERHITLDRAMYGSDQAASLERGGLETMVKRIREIPTITGVGVKAMAPGEAEVATKLRYWE